MNLNETKHIYFLGIGGIGMSGLARYFVASGKSVAGYDKTQTPLTDALTAEGISITYKDDVKELPEDLLKDPGKALVVLTPAVPTDLKLWKFFKEKGVEIKKRSEVLGEITAKAFTIAVAGTHGKTTTSTMIAHLLRSAEVDCSAFLGGISKNYNSNLLLGTNLKRLRPKPIMVVEADEYDRSFLTLKPDIAVITSADPDHLDIYGSREKMLESFRQFALQVKDKGVIIVKKGLEEILDLKNVKPKVMTYSLDQDSDFYAKKIAVKRGEFVFDSISSERMIRGIQLPLPGRHNVENAVGAIAVASQMSMFTGNIKNSFANFQGIKRRFEVHVKSSKAVYIDDYAHHPEELNAAISAARELFPSKKITGIFQPHLFSRTRDFADAFAESLSKLDELILLEIYPAREKPIAGINSAMLLDKVKLEKKILVKKEDLLGEIEKRSPQVLMTLGAGDIDAFTGPITELLSKRIQKK